jgi:hypothetical protein
MGLSLVVLQLSAPRGWLGGLLALLGLVPVGLALGFGGVRGAAAATVVALLGTAVVDVWGAVLIGFKHLGPGLVLGLVVRPRMPLTVALLAVTGASLLGLGVLVWGILPPGASPWALLERNVEAHVADLEALPSRLGLSGNPGWASESGRAVASAIRVAGPGILVVGLLLGAVLNYVLVRLCLRREGFRRFADETVPDHLVWGVIVGGVLAISGQTALTLVGVNGLLVLAALYAIQGLAVLRHLFVRARVPRVLQVATFGVFVLQPLLLLVVAGVGLVDLWLDFRKIRGAPTPA